MSYITISKKTTTRVTCFLDDLDYDYTGQRQYIFEIYEYGYNIVLDRAEVWDATAATGALEGPPVTFRNLLPDTRYTIRCNVYNAYGDMITPEKVKHFYTDAETVEEPEEPVDEEWEYEKSSLGTYYDSATVRDVNPSSGEVEFLWFEPEYDGTLTVTSDFAEDMYGWLFNRSNKPSLSGTSSSDDADAIFSSSTSGYLDDDNNAGVSSNFKLSGDVYAGETYLVCISALHYDTNPDRGDVDLNFKPFETRWRCFDLETQEYISPYNTSTNEPYYEPIECPTLEGYTYVGYTSQSSWSKAKEAANSGNFRGTGTTSTSHNYDTREDLLFCYRKIQVISSWQTPQLMAEVSGSTYPASYSATSTVNAYNAGYVKYTPPSYRGKLTFQTISSSSVTDYYSHFSTSTLLEGAGTARNAAVTGSILSDDNGAGGLNTRISYICPASTGISYYWYVNAAWAQEGTINIPWELTFSREYIIKYDLKGGVGSIPDQAFYTDNLSVSLTTQTPSKTNYIFKGWDVDSAATNVVYGQGATVSLTARDITLYAVWEEALSTYTITYNANGGNGAPAQLNALQNSTVTIDTTTIPTKSNYIFKGWSTVQNAKNPLYKKGRTYTINMQSNIALYAVWWEDFNWDLRNAVEGQTFNNLIVNYIGTTNNNNLTTGDIYDVLWFNNIATKVKHPSKVSGDLITDEDLNGLVEYYKNY